MKRNSQGKYRSDFLKQSEIFVLLSLALSIFVGALLEENRQYEDKALAHQSQIDSLNSLIDLSPDTIVLNNAEPPVIIIDDAHQGEFFEVGSAVINHDLLVQVETNLVDTIKYLLRKYPKTNAIYVIGHTDHQRLANANPNFEEQLVGKYCETFFPHWNVPCGSNSELGMLRAYSIMRLLQELDVLEYRIDHWYAFSAGAFIDQNGDMVNEFDYEDVPSSNGPLRSEQSL